jgi:hypothetical protein
MTKSPVFNIHVVTDERLTILEPMEVRRSWWERLTSRPWRLWKATKVILIKFPDPRVFRMNQGQTIICHPDTFAVLVARMRQGIHAVGSGEERDGVFYVTEFATSVAPDCECSAGAMDEEND